MSYWINICKASATVWAVLFLCTCQQETKPKTATHPMTAMSVVDRLVIHTENNASFLQRLELIASARESIDLAYYIYDRDFTSAYFTLQLIEKARAGIKVRLLVDWMSTSSYPEFFQMMVKQGGGNLSIAYFRPPPPLVIEDLENLGVKDPLAFLAALVALDWNKALKEWLRPTTAFHFHQPSPVQQAAHRADLAGLLPALNKWEEHDGTVWSADFFEDRSKALASATGDSTWRFIHLPAWFDLTKRLHHKMIVVDKRHLMGGGRNIQDAYHWEMKHPLRLQHHNELSMPFVFMDADFLVDSEDLAQEAVSGFEQYFDCATDGPLCLIPYGAWEVREDADPALLDAEYAALQAKAAEFLPYLDHPPVEPVQDFTLNLSQVAAEYFQNTMHPKLSSDATYLYEYPSEFNRKWVQWMDETVAGQQIILQNAYLFFPSKLILAAIRAVKRGVKLILITNSSESSDLGFVSKLARFQYRELLKLGERHGGAVEIYEYHTEEALHSKVSLFGSERMSVSSVNADPRSEYLDTNNGIYIQDARATLALRDWLIKLRARLLKEGRMKQISLPWLEATSRSEQATQSEEYAMADWLLRQIFAHAYTDPDTASTAQKERSERARHFIDMLFIQI